MTGQVPPQPPAPAEEKRDEPWAGGGHWMENRRRDPLSGIIWGAIFLWAGLALLASNLGLLPANLLIPGWGLVFTGAGLILLLEAFLRLAIPVYRRPVVGTAVLGVIFLGVGLQGMMRWELLWPLVLILLGLVVLLRNAARER